MKKIPMLSAEKAGNGRIKTIIEGTGDDALELLTMLNCSVASIMLEAGNDPEVIEAALKHLASKGVAMATAGAGTGGTKQ